MGTIIHNNEQNQIINNSDNIWDQIEKAQKTVLQQFQKNSLAQNYALKGLERIAEDTTLESASAVLDRKFSSTYFFRISPAMMIGLLESQINLQVRSFNVNIGELVTVYKYLDRGGNIQIKLHKETFECFWELMELVDKTEKEIQRKFPDSNSIARINTLKKMRGILDCQWPFKDKIEEIESIFPFF